MGLYALDLRQGSGSWQKAYDGIKEGHVPYGSTEPDMRMRCFRYSLKHGGNDISFAKRLRDCHPHSSISRILDVHFHVGGVFDERLQVMQVGLQDEKVRLHIGSESKYLVGDSGGFPRQNSLTADAEGACHELFGKTPGGNYYLLTSIHGLEDADMEELSSFLEFSETSFGSRQFSVANFDLRYLC